MELTNSTQQTQTSERFSSGTVLMRTQVQAKSSSVQLSDHRQREEATAKGSRRRACPRYVSALLTGSAFLLYLHRSNPDRRLREVKTLEIMGRRSPSTGRTLDNMKYG